MGSGTQRGDQLVPTWFLEKSSDSPYFLIGPKVMHGITSWLVWDLRDSKPGNKYTGKKMAAYKGEGNFSSLVF